MNAECGMRNAEQGSAPGAVAHEKHERKDAPSTLVPSDTSYHAPADSLRTTTSLCSGLQGGDAGADFTAVELQQMLEDKLAVLEVEQRELKRLLAADLELDGNKRGVIDV